MDITVKLFATFRIGRFAENRKRFSLGTTIADIVRELHIPEEQIGIIMLNSRHAQLAQQLSDGDQLAIFPLLGGG